MGRGYPTIAILTTQGRFDTHAAMNGLRHTPIALVVALLLMAGCDGPKETPAPTPDKGGPDKAPASKPAEPAAKAPLTVYCGRNEKLIGPVLEAFTKETGIKVTPKYGKTQQLATQLLKEGAKTTADVFIAQDASTLGYLDSKSVFAPLGADTLGKVDAAYHGPNKTWIGATGRARVLVYDTNKVKPEDIPADVNGLTDPRWKGKVGWAPENASFKSFVAAMIQLEGPEATQAWLEKMRDNEPKAYPKNTPAVRAVHKGEVEVALVNHYYLFRVSDEMGGTKAANHYFKNGKAESMVNLTGAAVLKTSKNTGDAEKLVAFLVGPTAQAHFAGTVHEFPVVAGTKAEGIPALTTLNAPKLDVAKLDNLEQTEKLLRAAKILE